MQVVGSGSITVPSSHRNWNKPYAVTPILSVDCTSLVGWTGANIWGAIVANNAGDIPREAATFASWNRESGADPAIVYYTFPSAINISNGAIFELSMCLNAANTFKYQTFAFNSTVAGG